MVTVFKFLLSSHTGQFQQQSSRVEQPRKHFYSHWDYVAFMHMNRGTS